MVRIMAVLLVFAIVLLSGVAAPVQAGDGCFGGCTLAPVGVTGFRATSYGGGFSQTTVFRPTVFVPTSSVSFRPTVFVPTSSVSFRPTAVFVPSSVTVRGAGFRATNVNFGPSSINVQTRGFLGRRTRTTINF